MSLDGWTIEQAPPTAQFHLLLTAVGPEGSPITLSEVVAVEYRENDDPFISGYTELPTHQELYERAMADFQTAHPGTARPAVLHFSANRNRLT
ncbi:hypothetical protein ACIRPK_23750 [Kitasatospora sp. NPDC101801]|uniref:hypothetical protein n=1 Tax=Kitasatospora sp. NPDC101801 TaxID=3364103 RepID=UPI0037F9E0B7